MRAVLAALLGLVTASAAQSASVLVARGTWAALEFGSRCEARSKALWARSGTEPYLGFAFEAGGRRDGQFYVHLSWPARAGATVIATVGANPFLLAGRGEWAWSTTAEQHRAILEAARYGQSLRVESRDARGRRIVDRYALAGAPTAIDSAAAACAGKIRPR
jgi:hypothetical protein